MAKKFKVTLKKSLIGCTDDQIRTVNALGLRKIHQTVTLVDNSANRGQLFKIQHMLDIQVSK